MNLIIFGPPGSGKGTQAKLLADHFDLIHVSSGQLLRHASEQPTSTGRVIKQTLESGQLLEFPLVLEVIAPFLSTEKGFVLDGTPRNQEQAAHLEKYFQEKNITIDAVILLELDDQLALKRLLHRAETQGRSDDTKAVIDERLRIYHQETKPLIEHYTQQGKLLRIDGSGSVEDVFQATLKKLPPSQL